MVSNLTLSDKLYRVMKWLTLIFLPAVSAAYFALSGQFDLPAVEQVVGSIAVLCTFLGTILGISTKNYEPFTDGQMLVLNKPDGGKTFSLDLDDDPANLQHQKTVTFRVVDAEQE